MRRRFNPTAGVIAGLFVGGLTFAATYAFDPRAIAVVIGCLLGLAFGFVVVAAFDAREYHSWKERGEPQSSPPIRLGLFGLLACVALGAAGMVGLYLEAVKWFGAVNVRTWTPLSLTVLAALAGFSLGIRYRTERRMGDDLL